MKPLLPLIITLIILLVPDLALAQNLPDVNKDGIFNGGGLIPCGQSADNTCNSCHVVILANTVVKWLIGITFMIFAAMAVYSGVKLVISGGNSSAKEDAKEMFTNAFIGLFIILGAWLMIDTLLRFVLKGGESGNIEGYGPWSQVKCVTEAKPGITNLAIEEEEFTPAMVNGVATPAGNASVAGAGLTAAEAKSRLTAAGIGIKPTAVLEGVKPHVITEAIKLKQACGCNLYVTDATGPGHGTQGEFTHAKGFKLDFRRSDNPNLISFIKSNFAPAGKWKDGTLLYYNAGSCATYALESDHVDVVYKTGC